MAFIFSDGFEQYSNNTDLSRQYIVANCLVNTTNPRTAGDKCVILQQFNELRYAFADTQNIIMGFAVRYDTLSAGEGIMVRFLDVLTAQNTLHIGSGGSLIWRDGNNTILGTSPINTLRANSYYYIEIKLTISNSISANSCVVRVNEEEVINLAAGTNTSNGGTANNYVNGFLFTSNNFGTYFDDVYLINNNGVGQSDFCGDVKLVQLLPNANGDQNQFTNSNNTQINNFTYVDDSTPDSDSTYVRGGFLNLVDLYGFSNFSETPTQIFAVNQRIFAKKDAGGVRKVKMLAKLGGNTFESNEINLTDNYLYYTDILELNPNTTVAWTETDINNAQFGIKVST